MESRVPSPDAASEPTLYAACAEDAQGGDYYGPGGFLEISGAPAKAKINSVALDPVVAGQLWSISESMTGVSFLSDL